MFSRSCQLSEFVYHFGGKPAGAEKDSFVFFRQGLGKSDAEVKARDFMAFLLKSGGDIGSGQGRFIKVEERAHDDGNFHNSACHKIEGPEAFSRTAWAAGFVNGLDHPGELVRVVVSGDHGGADCAQAMSLLVSG